MLLHSRASAYGSQRSLRLFFPLFTSLLIAAILNPNEVEGKTVKVDRTDDDVGDLEYPGLYESNGGWRVSRNQITTDDALSTTTSAPPLTTTRAVIPKTNNSNRHTSYTKGMTSPLGDDELEYSLDYYNEKAVLKEYDFNTTDILKRLTDSAIAYGTPPNQFLEDIQDLISLQNRSRTEQNESANRDESSKLQPGFLSENLLKRMSEGWKNELKRLEKKYNVSSECTDSQSITATRLALMFPHYLNFGQKPFAAPTNLTLTVGSTSQTYVCDRNGYNCHYEYNNKYDVPSFFERQEFSGLIPSHGSLSNETVRKVIIGSYLYALHRNDYNDMVPFRTKCVMLKRRMQKSVLSNKRRIRFLINNDIISKNGTLLRTHLDGVYAKIPSDFKVKIDWDLLQIDP